MLLHFMSLSCFRSALFRLDLDTEHCGECVAFVSLLLNQTYTFALISVCPFHSTPERLSGDNLSVSCPRLSPDGSTLIYLQGQVFGPHSQCLSLQQVVCMYVCLCVCACVFLLLNTLPVSVNLPQLDLKSGEISTLLDPVNRPQTGRLHMKWLAV